MKKKFNLPSQPKTFSQAENSIVLNLEIKLPNLGNVQPPPQVPSFHPDVIKQRLRDKIRAAAPITKKSSVAKMNQDIYPQPTTRTPPDSESGKGIAPKPRPGYYH